MPSTLQLPGKGRTHFFDGFSVSLHLQYNQLQSLEVNPESAWAAHFNSNLPLWNNYHVVALVLIPLCIMTRKCIWILWVWKCYHSTLQTRFWDLKSLVEVIDSSRRARAGSKQQWKRYHIMNLTSPNLRGGLGSVQPLSRVRVFVTPWNAARQASLSITNSWNLLKLMSIASEMPSNHLILCQPLLLLLSIPPSIRVFSNESVLHMRWLKYWSFSFSISPPNEHPGLISSKMDWLDVLAVQRTLKSLLQHHSSKASTLWCSAFFIVQLSHPYMTTGKKHSLD